MLNIGLPVCTKVELWDLDSLYCGKNSMQKSCSDLDLGPTMPNIELFRDIFIYYNVYSNFMFLNGLFFELSCKNMETHAHTHTHTYAHTHTHTHAHRL